MIKGVNRQVVEVSQTDCEYFEKVLFFVKPEYASVSEGKLRERADLIAAGTGAPPPTRIRRNRFLLAAKLLCAALAGAAVTCFLFSVL
jgi:hypothetical protein